MEEEKNPDMLMRLIDVSSEDDCLISSPSYTSAFLGNRNDHEYFELSEVEISQEREGALNRIMEREHELMLPESSEPERMRKTSKCNMRKSLAWDSAFFTSAGVLEPEELSFINCGLKKAVHSLPGIEEDIRRSAESNSTLGSDNLTLESLEVGLFEDIRASIQRSSEASNMTRSSSQAEPGQYIVQSFQSSRKMELASRIKMKPIATSKRQTITSQGLERTKKETESTKKEAEKTQREAQGTKLEASVRQRAVQAAKSGELNTLSLRPPKIAGRVNPVQTSPTKSISLGANRVRIKNNTVKSAIGRREPIGCSKRPVIGDPHVTPRCTPSPKSSSSSSVSGTKMESSASCSSDKRSGSTSSDSIEKSPFNSLRKKGNCRNVYLPSKNRNETENTRLSAYLMSVPKLSSSISPASSLDGWSSESSSSTSVNQYSNNSMKSLEISSPRKGFYLERGASRSDIQKHQHDQRRIEQKRTGLPSPCSKKAISGAGPLPRPVATDTSKSSKPSGLRMPSPKIGYFDAEKSTEPTHTGSLQFYPGVRSAIPKHGAGVGSPLGGTVRAKPGKLQPARTVRSSINCDSHPAGVPHCAASMRPTCPAQPRELNASPKVSDPKTTRGNSPRIISTLQSNERTVRGNHMMIGEVGEMQNTNKENVGSFLNEEEIGGQDDSVNKRNTTRKQLSAIKITRGNCPSITSTLKSDDSIIRGSHLMTREVGEMNSTNRNSLDSFLYDWENDGQDELLNSIDTTGEQVSLIKTTTREDCPGITSKLHKNMHHTAGIESLLKTKEVGESTNTEREHLNSFLNGEGNGSQDFFVNDIGSGSEKVSAANATRENQGVTSEQNDFYHRTSSGCHLKIGEVREPMNSENESLVLKEGENRCEDASVNDIGSLSENLLCISFTMKTPTEYIPQISCKPSSDCYYDNQTASSEGGEKLMHGQGQLESILSSYRESNEKENSLCYGNEVDGLSRYMRSIDPDMEDLCRKGSSLSQFDGETDGPEDTKLLLYKSREVLVHDQHDFSKVLLKSITQSLSPNRMDMLLNTRTPLAVKPSLCNKTGSSEFTSDSMTEKVSAYSITEGVQIDNS